MAVPRFRTIIFLTIAAVLTGQTHSEAPPRRLPTVNTVYRRLMRTALQLIAKEEYILSGRLPSGKDRPVPSYNELEPGILEAVERPLDARAEELGRTSRVINWIVSIARYWNLNLSLSDMLASREAVLYNLTCPFVRPADCSPNERYRRVDGRCNNLDHPLWGAGFTPMARDLPAQYDTGVIDGYTRYDLPRQTGKHSGLPSARLVSNMVHSASSLQLESSATMAFVFFGQMTAHDVTDTAFERGYQLAILDCCPIPSPARGCAGIPIPEGDFFRGFGRTCLGVPRAKEVTDLDCATGGREQLNLVSSFVDGSNLYGHTEETLKELRGKEGQLKVSIPNQLPHSRHPSKHYFEQGINFLNAGDERVSEVIGLTGITTILHREHNRVAEALAQFQRFSSIEDAEERNNAIFEEARKITIAIKQHITYNEFLRLAIGRVAMDKYDLMPRTSGYFREYDPTVNPSMTSEVIVSAQRFGHSLLRGILSVRNKDFNPTDDTLQLRKVFWRPNFYLLFENGFQRGVVTDNAEVCDRHITDEVRDHLFETKNGNGDDLIARNIQRGRDHGVPSYKDVRASFGLSTASTFTSGGATGFEHLTDEVVEKLQEVYHHPDDVDLFTGGISETPVTGGIVGPLFSELLGRQFKKLRVGDRFWYEREEHGFTPDQLDAIRKVSMARVMCDNVRGIDIIQRHAFRVPSSGNERVACNSSSLSAIDLNLWA